MKRVLMDLPHPSSIVQMLAFVSLCLLSTRSTQSAIALLLDQTIVHVVRFNKFRICSGVSGLDDINNPNCLTPLIHHYHQAHFPSAHSRFSLSYEVLVENHGFNINREFIKPPEWCRVGSYLSRISGIWSKPYKQDVLYNLRAFFDGSLTLEMIAIRPRAPDRMSVTSSPPES